MDEWVSEGVQVGGVASAMGVLGMWTGAQHERMDPLGELPTGSGINRSGESFSDICVRRSLLGMEGRLSGVYGGLVCGWLWLPLLHPCAECIHSLSSLAMY